MAEEVVLKTWMDTIEENQLRMETRLQALTEQMDKFMTTLTKQVEALQASVSKGSQSQPGQLGMIGNVSSCIRTEDFESHDDDNKMKGALEVFEKMPTLDFEPVAVNLELLYVVDKVHSVLQGASTYPGYKHIILASTLISGGLTIVARGGVIDGVVTVYMQEPWDPGGLAKPTSTRLLEDDANRTVNEKKMLKTNAEKASSLFASMSQSSDLNFFRDACRGTSRKGCEEETTNRYRGEVTHLGSLKQPSDLPNVDFEQCKIKVHRVSLSDHILDLIDHIQNSPLAILSLFATKDDFELLSLPKGKLLKLIGDKGESQFSSGFRDETLVGLLALPALKQTQVSLAEPSDCYIKPKDKFHGDVLLVPRVSNTLTTKGKVAEDVGAYAILIINKHRELYMMVGDRNKTEMVIGIPAILLPQDAGASVEDNLSHNASVAVQLYYPNRPHLISAKVSFWLMVVGTILGAFYWSTWSERQTSIEHDKLLEDVLDDVPNMELAGGNDIVDINIKSAS